MVGPAPLIGRMCEALGVTEVIDRLTDWDPGQCRLSPGTRIKALVVNILTARRPLYRVSEAFEAGDVELAVGAGVEIGHLSDDCLARALDKLVAAGPKRIYSALVARAVLTEGLVRTSVHWDSTLRAVYGVYDRPNGMLAVVHGHSKEHRPDLKQFLIALLCNREGIPLSAEVQDGNHSDKRGNAEAIDELVATLSPEALRATMYVADSALCTGPNLQKMREVGLRFVTRLPDTFGAVEAVKRQAWAENRWVGAVGHGQGRRALPGQRTGGGGGRGPLPLPGRAVRPPGRAQGEETGACRPGREDTAAAQPGHPDPATLRLSGRR